MITHFPGSEITYLKLNRAVTDDARPSHHYR